MLYLIQEFYQFDKGFGFKILVIAECSHVDASHMSPAAQMGTFIQIVEVLVGGIGIRH